MTIADYVAASPSQRLSRGLSDHPGVRLAQVALVAAGHDLVTDGDFGRITEAAVKRFQGANGLAVVGYIGPKTSAALDAELARVATVGVSPPRASVLGVAPWLSIMRAITGTKEIPGTADNPLIVGWVAEIVTTYPDLHGTVGWYADDSTPWCGLVMGYVVTKAGFRPPRLLLGAANWANDWPDGVRLREPSLGCIMVMTRTGGGHVTLYEGEDDDYYYGRGGNQSDMVNVARFPKSRNYLGFMWPKNAPAPTGGRVRTTFNAAVSVKEG